MIQAQIWSFEVLHIIRHDMTTYVMGIAIVVYFVVHGLAPDKFTETVLGIIVGGSATNSVITTFNIVYKHSMTRPARVGLERTSVHHYCGCHCC